MEKEHFEIMKQDLESTYDDELCKPSKDAIREADSISNLIAVLRKFSVLPNYKPIPRIAWIRQWLGDYADELADMGCFVDRHVAMNEAPKNTILLYGNANLTLIATRPAIYNVVLHDNSELTLFAGGTAIVKVYKFSDSKVNIIEKARTAQVRIINHESPYFS